MQLNSVWMRSLGLWLLCALMALSGPGVRSAAGARHAEGERARGAKSAQPMPQALRAAYIQAVEAEGGAGYAVRPGPAGLVADNPAQGLAISFSEEGLALAASGARATLRPVHFGCRGALRKMERAAPEAREGRVEYRREGFAEWYVNGPLGVEQGFTVAEAAGCGEAEGGELEVELALGEGLSARLGEDGEQVDLRDPSGKKVLGYSELYATDATGKVLSARLGVVGETGVSIRVEAEGAAYPVVIDPLIWKEQQKLKASDGAMDDEFGTSVALSGDTALVGDISEGQQTGAAYMFVRSGSSWVQQQKLVVSDGGIDDDFGWSVALSGDTALIGDYGDEKPGAYVFVRSGSSWVQQQKLVASDEAVGDYFGWSVALSGDAALVGAPYKGKFTGAAYIFVRSGSSWVQQQKLVASDGAVYDYFGTSVALSGDTALVGAPVKGQDAGAAYVFVRSGSSWIQQQKVLPSGVEKIIHFGGSVALSGDSALVGTTGSSAHAAYIFIRSGSSWAQQQKLLVSDATATSVLEDSVALSGASALVGARANGQEAGAAYVFDFGLTSGDACTTNADCASRRCFGSACVDPVTSCTSAKNGTPCDDGNPCTSQDTCQDGQCLGEEFALCPDPPATEACLRPLCLPAVAACGIAEQLDGAPCPGGICIAGGCYQQNASSSTSAVTTTSTGGPSTTASTSATTTTSAGPTSTSASGDSVASAGGAGGAGGEGGAPGGPPEIRLHGGGCDCSTGPGSKSGAKGLLLALLPALVCAARRGKSRQPRWHRATVGAGSPRLPLEHGAALVAARPARTPPRALPLIVLEQLDLRVGAWRLRAERRGPEGTGVIVVRREGRRGRS